MLGLLACFFALQGQATSKFCCTDGDPHGITSTHNVFVPTTSDRRTACNRAGIPGGCWPQWSGKNSLCADRDRAQRMSRPDLRGAYGGQHSMARALTVDYTEATTAGSCNIIWQPFITGRRQWSARDRYRATASADGARHLAARLRRGSSDASRADLRRGPYQLGPLDSTAAVQDRVTALAGDDIANSVSRERSHYVQRGSDACHLVGPQRHWFS